MSQDETAFLLEARRARDAEELLTKENAELERRVRKLEAEAEEMAKQRTEEIMGAIAYGRCTEPVEGTSDGSQ